MRRHPDFVYFVALRLARDVVVCGWLGGSLVVAQPVITAQPNNQFLAPGETAIFSVSQTGAGPFAYQWLFDGTAMPGRTGRILSLANPQPSQWGDYSVIISNASGFVTSQVAQLKVFAATPHRLDFIETKTNGSINLSFAGETTPLSP
jgi:hypothetical protein